MDGSPLATLVTLFVGLFLLLADEWIRSRIDGPGLREAALEQRMANIERDLDWVPVFRQRLAELETVAEGIPALQQRLAELERAVEGIPALEQRVADLERDLHQAAALQASLQVELNTLQVEFNALRGRSAEGGDRV